MTQVKIEVLQSTSQLLNKYRSIVVKLGDSPKQEAHHTLQKSLLRQLSARLRFFRQATSTLMSISLSSQEHSKVSIVTETLKPIRDAFFQLQESQFQLSSSRSIATEEMLKLNVDLNDVTEKLRSLNETIENHNRSEVHIEHSQKDEL